MNIMQNIQTKRARLTRKLAAFTLLESLLTLSIVATLTILLSGTVKASFHSVEEQVFFLQFEHFYKESQSLAVSSNQTVDLQLTSGTISNGKQSLIIPERIHLAEEKTITFDGNGGNSSLSKISFQTDDKTVQYQLYLGSGRYKKSEK